VFGLYDATLRAINVICLCNRRSPAPASPMSTRKQQVSSAEGPTKGKNMKKTKAENATSVTWFLVLTAILIAWFVALFILTKRDLPQTLRKKATLGQRMSGKL
jgi:hypothetical protein